jgi:hypothetical protein
VVVVGKEVVVVVGASGVYPPPPPLGVLGGGVGAVVVEVTGAGSMLRASTLVMANACAEESVAVTVTSKSPVSLGDPLISKEPSAWGLAESPCGRPTGVLQVNGAVPAVGTRDCEYGAPTVPSGRGPGVMAGVGTENRRVVVFAVRVEPEAGAISVPGYVGLPP